MASKDLHNHQKTYTIILESAIPVVFRFDHCQEKNVFYQKKNFIKTHTVIVKNVSDLEFNESMLDLPNDIKQQLINKNQEEYNIYVNNLKNQVMNKNFNGIDFLKCDKCLKYQGWQSEHRFKMNLGYNIFISIVLVLLFLLLSIIFKNAILELTTFFKTGFLNKLFNQPILVGLILGFITAILYFIFNYKKIINYKYNSLNGTEKNEPDIQFDNAIAKIKVLPYLYENRLIK